MKFPLLVYIYTISIPLPLCRGLQAQAVGRTGGGRLLVGGRGLLFLTSAEQPHHQPQPHLCAVVQSSATCYPQAHSTDSFPATPILSTQPLTVAPQAVPSLIYSSEGCAALCSAPCFPPRVQTPPKNFQPTAAGLLYMLPNHSISQTSACSREEARGGAGAQGSSSLSPCCRKESFSPKPNDWT